MKKVSICFTLSTVWTIFIVNNNTKIMAVYQERGNKLNRKEVAFLKSLFNRFRNDRQVGDLFEEVVGKRISNSMVNHIRTGKRWKNVIPSAEMDFEE